MSNNAPKRQLEERQNAAKPAKVEDEEDDMSLPPLDADDGEARDEEEDDTDHDDFATDVAEEEADPFDDANATDLDIGADIDDDDDEDPSDEGHESAIDVGPLDEDIDALADEERAAHDDEASGTVVDEEDDDLDTDTTRDDGGAEGTGENAEDDVDESALPDLDESEHDEADESLADILLEEAEAGNMPPWASRRFVLLETIAEAATNETSVPDDEAWRTLKLRPELAAFVAEDPGRRLVTTREGAAVAIVAKRSLHVSKDGGQTFESVDLHGVLAACFAGDEEDAPLYALIAAPAEGVVFLVRITEDGEPSRVAELSVPDLANLSMSWDGSRDVVWVRSSQGRSAFGLSQIT